MADTPDGTSGPTGSAGYAAEAGRYHLYVAYICPWASRTLIARKLKKLACVIGISVVEPALTDQGWRFGGHPGSDLDTVNGATYLHEIYSRADPAISGRATMPVLWDKRTGTIVSNESADILRIMITGFGELADPTFDLYPTDLQSEIDAMNESIYGRFNNGVYRAGFATTQEAYEKTFHDVFTTLEDLETLFRDGRTFLLGERFTESDIRLFVTLVRFDVAYHGLFKCNLRRIADYARLAAYQKRALSIPGVRETVHVDHIKRGYYSIAALNPSRIVPLGPEIDL